MKAMSPLIELKGLTKRYNRRKEEGTVALNHVNLSIEKGDIYGIIGFSGAGKSTLMRCLATLEKPTFGQVWIDGQEITGFSENQLIGVRKHLGMIFQQFNLFSSRTVAENIAYPLEIAGIDREERGRRVSELIGLVGLTEQKNAYPAQLSGGQKQRVGIARALAGGPKILLCDEATSALDPQTTQEILALLRSLKEKLDLTIVLITHEMEVVKQVCNKVAVLEKGELVESGPISQVFVEPKAAATKAFAQKTIHEIPKHLLTGKGKVYHLHFKGEKTEEPVITQMAKQFSVDANILLGWIDSLQTVTIGNLIVEMTGAGIDKAISYLRERSINVEEVHQ